ncbi:MAG: hypothetical protein WBO12_02815 [Xanthobacteraceae bacterium]
MTNSPERNGNAQAAPPNSASDSELSRARSEALNVVQWLARSLGAHRGTKRASTRPSLQQVDTDWDIHSTIEAVDTLCAD